MSQFIVAFITGLTMGGLSCLAVQGGLLASSLERQVELEVAVQQTQQTGKSLNRFLVHPRLAIPILLFLAAKLVTYTLLGFLLGALGLLLQLNNITRAILLIAVGIFMLGNALRMFNVHPIFRYFAIEPPKFITRYIRRKSKNGDGFFAPLFLGALTVFIPCGVTQAMMAAAVGSGSALTGAALMFAFILGTSPTFFVVAFLAMQLGARLEKWFMRFVAVIILILGLVSVNSGLTLMGSPLAVTNLLQSVGISQTSLSVDSALDGVSLVLTASNDGYSPRTLHARANTSVTLNVVTDQNTSCSRSFVIPALKVERLLPETGTVVISIPAQRYGTVMPFTCSMGMHTGQIVFDH